MVLAGVLMGVGGYCIVLAGVLKGVGITPFASAYGIVSRDDPPLPGTGASTADGAGVAVDCGIRTGIVGAMSLAAGGPCWKSLGCVLAELRRFTGGDLLRVPGVEGQNNSQM